MNELLWILNRKNSIEKWTIPIGKNIFDYLTENKEHNFLLYLLIVDVSDPPLHWRICKLFDVFPFCVALADLFEANCGAGLNDSWAVVLLHPPMWLSVFQSVLHM